MRLLIYCLLISICTQASAYAQSARTFVSSYGSDSNPCSRQAPCRSFATAITKTAAGGEINTLDPGGYGAFEITKAISIVSGLGEAGVLVPEGGTGITINAGANDQINLRGLAIEGAGVGATGIRLNSGGSLTITNCVVRNLTTAGIDIEPTADTRFTITDTLVSDTQNVGLYVYPQGLGSSRGHIERVTSSRNQYGFFLNGTTPANRGQVYVTIVDSAASQNNKGVGYGIFGDHALVYVARSTMTGNKVGFNSQTATMYLGSSLIGANGVGVMCAGTVRSYGDNKIDFNDNGDGWSCFTVISNH